MKYIPAEELIAEIERLKKRAEHYEKISLTDGERSYWSGESGLLELLTSFITSRQKEVNIENYKEQPEYGYLSTEYIHGKKPRWNVGDILAYYVRTSNEEGEYVIGKVSNVEFDDEEGWLYTFENEDVCDEQYLVEEGVYKKNR